MSLQRPSVAALFATCLTSVVACSQARDRAGAAGGGGAAAQAVTACSGCHGGPDNAAPPTSVKGLTATTELAVGAHQAHLRGGAVRAGIACQECHVVPALVDEPGHMDKDHADVTFGTLAGAGGATPAWDRGSATCTTYCHGATLPGGTNTHPKWTQVDGSQAACGSCHGAPPPAATGHPAVSGGPSACASCHPDTVKADGTIDLAGGKHIDGKVQIGALGCTGCHGDGGRQDPAPPRGTHGETATTDRAVGAHQRHLQAGRLRGAIACAECHVVPGDLSHVNGSAEVAFGSLARSGGAAPSWNGSSCASTYCHGGTLRAGGSNTAPVWTQVDQGQTACGTCHGAPPPPSTGHPAVTGLDSCSRCHPGVKADGTIDLAAGTHIDGKVDLADLTCTSCHGDASRPDPTVRAAPPLGTHGETATSTVAVGAHQIHLAGGALRAGIACGECHAVPTTTSHSNGTVDVAFGTLARSGGASPAWDHQGAGCASTYCHGATLNAGGSNTRPIWTQVDGTQTACGTCHGAPPPASTGHPAVSSDLTGCAGCHSATVRADGTIDVAGGKHIDGQVEVTGGACNACHGSATSIAPPRGTRGETATTTLAVGAHQSHLNDGALRRAVACSECHVVPGSTNGHPSGTVAVTFGSLATTGGARPTFDASTASCASTYCHGATLGAGGSNTRPVWTRVDGSQAACGTCHGAPPPASSGHPAATGGLPGCASCHPDTIRPDGTIDVSGGRHMNGVLDVIALSCSSCHGDATRASNPAAPPRGTRGETATTARAVGAHQAHLEDGPLRQAVACTECHVVPTSPGHATGSVDLTFGPLARASGASPTWNGSSCSSTYCHGGTIVSGGGSNTTPVWTSVGSGQTACGTCHGLPPPAAQGHPAVSGDVTTCGGCHPGTVRSDGTIDVGGGLHMNGTVDVTGLTCTSCHGDAARAQNPAAPPRGTGGETATTARAVGAHQAHLTGGTIRQAVACGECHVVPTSTAHSNGVVDLAFGPLARSDGASPTWDGSSCSSTYCHGGTITGGGGSNTAPRWTSVGSGQAACGTCHGLPPPATQGHPAVSGGLTACSGCHPDTVTASGTINLAGGKHINGTVDVTGMTCTSCHGDATRATNPAAPPRGTGGETATSARAVGAHQSHLTSNAMRGALNCSDCHVVPTSTSHSDGSVTLTFSALANTGTTSTWNGTSCATYCHGATLLGGSNRNPIWTTVNGTQAACGTCHGTPPGTGQHGRSEHRSAGCGACHSGYTATSVNTALHINGSKNVGGTGTRINSYSAGRCSPACHGTESW